MKNKHQRWLQLATKASLSSTCILRQVGCLIVKNNKVLVSSYNQQHPDLNFCPKNGCQRQQKKIPGGTNLEQCNASHAETTAIAACAKYGIKTNQAQLYTSTYPCAWCAKSIVNAGITEVYYQTPYTNQAAQETLKAAQIQTYKL